MFLYQFSNKILSKPKTLQLIRYKTGRSAQYCMESVKQNDYENFMCTLLLKSTARTKAFAIRSFNIEIARIAEQVSQANIGLMRMKFWEEALEKCYVGNKIPEHPVAIELYKVLCEHKLSKRYFKTLMSCRQEKLGINTFNKLEDLEKYGEQSVSSVYYLILEANGIKDIHADHAASHLGKAQGIAQLIRSIPHARRLNLISIPQDILAKNRVSQEEILRGKESERLCECIYEVASRAHQHLVKSRNLIDKVPKNGRPVLLPAVAVNNYLEKLQKVQYNIFHPSLQHRGWMWLMQLWLRYYKNKY